MLNHFVRKFLSIHWLSPLLIKCGMSIFNTEVILKNYFYFLIISNIGKSPSLHHPIQALYSDPARRTASTPITTISLNGPASEKSDLVLTLIRRILLTSAYPIHFMACFNPSFSPGKLQAPCPTVTMDLYHSNRR